MFDLQSLAAFVIAGLLLNLTPGPDVLYIVARSTSQGRMAGIVSTFGITTGCLVHIVAAAAGLSALMMKLPIAYEIVRWAGAAYLVGLGVRALVQKQSTLASGVGALERQPLSRIFAQGVFTNVLNPKVAMFFLAFLPQFTDPARGPVAMQLLLLGLLFNFNSLFVNLGYALLASRLGDWLRGRFSLARTLDKITGGLFIALGVRLALSPRK